jgi:preprotein translocase subunit YajC
VVATAWAQGAGAVPTGPSAAIQFFPFILVFFIFYLLVVRPEQKKRQAQQSMLAGLKRNDTVIMTGGLHGRVTALAEDVVTVEIAPKVLVQFDRSAVQSIRTPPDGGGARKSGNERE